MSGTPIGAVAEYRWTRTLWDVRTQRHVVDYSLQRRALLAKVYAGLTSTMDVCDANPYLVRAARFHGRPSTLTCPVCRKEQLTVVSWVYGDELGQVAGSARSPAELEAMATRYCEFSVYDVEVCRSCSWNHLVRSRVLGTGEDRATRRPSKSAGR